MSTKLDFNKRKLPRWLVYNFSSTFIPTGVQAVESRAKGVLRRLKALKHSVRRVVVCVRLLTRGLKDHCYSSALRDVCVHSTMKDLYDLS